MLAILRILGLFNDPTGETSQIQLNHEEVSWEYYSGQVFPTLELVKVVERHHGTNLQLRALGTQFCGEDSEPTGCLLRSTYGQTKKEVVLLAILLEEVCHRDKA